MTKNEYFVVSGGANYAHTIVGIDFDEMTGSVKYLIVDPHFTGNEDIKVITNKVYYIN